MHLAPCLLHRTYHHQATPDCYAHAAAWFIDHRHFDPRQAGDAYEAAVEAAILDHHIRQHLKESRMSQPDDDGERQPPPQREELPTAA